MISTLQSHEVALNWNLIESFLFEHPEWTPQDVRTELEAQRAQIWLLETASGTRGIVITQLRGKTGIIWIASGRGLDAEAMQLLGAIESWMKECGCEEVKIMGRRGWKRVLNGYEERSTVFVKRL